MAGGSALKRCGQSHRGGVHVDIKSGSLSLVWLVVFLTVHHFNESTGVACSLGSHFYILCAPLAGLGCLAILLRIIDRRDASTAKRIAVYGSTLL